MNEYYSEKFKKIEYRFEPKKYTDIIYSYLTGRSRLGDLPVWQFYESTIEQINKQYPSNYINGIRKYIK